jgi:hypothetical protein
MARGFESKDVEFQQDEAGRSQRPRRALTPVERDLAARRLSLELALSKVRAERDAATNPRHRQMLEHAIQALENELHSGGGH